MRAWVQGERSHSLAVRVRSPAALLPGWHDNAEPAPILPVICLAGRTRRCEPHDVAAARGAGRRRRVERFTGRTSGGAERCSCWLPPERARLELRPDRQRLGELMRRLGYDRYAAQGRDVGALISLTLAGMHPERVAEVHVNFLITPPPATRRSWRA